MKPGFYFRVLIILMLVTNVNPVAAQQVVFKKMLPEANLPNLTAVTQDPKGIMWLSTVTELVRYDGYSITSYRHDALNPNSLGGIRLECVYADKDGIIWVGLFGNGLDRFDPSTGIFTHYRYNSKDPSSLGHDIVTCLFEDKDHNFWVGTHGGLDKLDRVTGKFTHYTYKNNDPTTISNDQVRIIYQDREGTLWIGTGSPWIGLGGLPGEVGIAGEGGLNRMDIKTGKFIRYLHNPNDTNSLINNKVRAIFEDSRGNFWIGTQGDGLHIMDRKAGTFHRYAYDPQHPENLSRPPVNKQVVWDHISFITEDTSGAIWIGTSAGGISRYDVHTKKIMHYLKDAVSGFTDIGVFGHYISRDGVFWITTLSGNLFTISPYQLIIPHYPQSGGPIAFYKNNDSVLWIGTFKAGLIRKDLKHQSLKQFPVKGIIYHMAKDNKDNLWVASYGYGVYQLNLQTQTLTQYKHSDTTKNSLINDSVYTVYLDREQNVWAGTENGLDKIDANTGKFIHYLHSSKDSTSISGNVILNLLADKNGDLWIGCGDWGGINKMDVRSGKCEHYLEGYSVRYIIETDDGGIWAGSNNSLNHYDPDKNNFTRVANPVTAKDFSSVSGIVEDEQHNLWLSEALGLIRLNVKNNESFTFGKNAGVESSSANSIYNFSGYKDEQGQLYFGDTSGYYFFNPASFLMPKPPEILFTNFSIGNRPVKTSENGALQTELWKAEKISMGYDQNGFAFEFIPVDYNNPTENNTLYKLENYDNEWRITTNPGKAYYYNVPPGKYIFKVKASNNMGVWAGKDILVTIAPPWWRTWWAYCVYVLLFITGVYLLHRVQKQRVIKSERERSRERELVQAKEIEKAYHELKVTQSQLIHSEKMASLGELTAGIAHEIQNPLNFVNNFSEVNKELLVEMKDEMSKGNLEDATAIANDVIDNEEKINHHGKRADAIVKGMLQHSRSSTGVKEPTSINALADEYLRLAYHGLRAKDNSFNATMKTDFDESLGNINIVPQDIGRVLLNLYNNAFYAVSEKKKHQAENYEPTVSIKTKKLDGKIEISVKDNGNGIPQKVVDKIFQPFFTTKPTGQGTGLGLSLAYDIIKAHGGEIKVDAKEREGTIFSIQLPINS